MKRNQLTTLIGTAALALTGLALTCLSGCQSQHSETMLEPELTDPLAVVGADMERSTEVELVEQMARYRQRYGAQLELLEQFYDRQGNHLKASWARDERDHLRTSPQREYLVIAEVAGPDLRAAESIPAADGLYEQGMGQYKDARKGLGSLFFNKKKIIEAKETFNQLITNYPNSDKIDDAAFQIGEIYRHHLKDYPRAMLYYQRVWQWDPQTPLPARFAVARLYDDYLHDGPKAIQYYQQAINLESGYPDNMNYANRRIKELSSQPAQPR